MKKQLQLAAIALMAFTGLRSQTASCLNFDGSSSYVNCGNILTPSYTKEAWVNINTTGTNNNMISGAAAGQHAFWAPSGYGYKLSAGHNGSWNQVQDPTPLTAGVWYHVAVSYDATSGTFVLYKNGVMVSTSTGNPGYNGGNLLLLGAYDPGSNLYNGTMDEVRIWNYVRSAADIQANMNCELSTGITPAGLIAYYNFNEGVPAAANPGVTTLFDMSGNMFNGTLNGFALSGPTSNWVNGTPVLSTPVLTVSGTNTLCAGASVTQMASGATTYSWSTTALSSSISVSPAVSTTYSVWGIGSNTCISSASVNVYVSSLPPVSATTTSSIICAGQTPTLTAMPATSYGLSLNGTSAYLDVASNTNIPINSNPYTMEAWVKPNSVSGANGIIGWGNWGNGNQTNAFRFNGSTQLINYWWGNDLVVSCPNVLDGFWHHFAATFDGITRKIYMDGVLLGFDHPTTLLNVPFSNNLAIGTTNNYSELLDGTIDDVRIWNVARTQTDLQDNMNNCLKGNEPGLVALYLMNDGTGSATVTDLTSSANTATLTGMNPATDWVAGYNNCDVYYLWAPSSATTQVVAVTPSVTTTYTVSFSNFNGCTANAAKMITVDTPTLAVTGATAVCTGNSATLTASGANTYTWSTSSTATTIVVSPTTAATYSLSGTSATGCTSSVSAVHTVTVLALPTLSVSTSNTMLCTGQTATLTASGATTYTWSTSATTTSVAITPTTTASYTVTGTNGNGCSNMTTFTQTVSTCTGINEQTATASISIYPNPNNGTFNLQVNEANGSYELVILNALGQKVHAQAIVQGTNAIMTAGLAKGIYQYVLLSNSRPAGAGKLVIE